METSRHETTPRHIPWNKGKLIGQKHPLKLKDIWAIRIRLQVANNVRELALFNLAIDSKLQGCDLVQLKVSDVAQGGRIASRPTSTASTTAATNLTSASSLTSSWTVSSRPIRLSSTASSATSTSTPKPTSARRRTRNRRLKNLLEDFAKLDLRPSRVSEDVIGNTYIYLIERFAADAGEFYTSKQVSRLLARLAKPEPGNRICDPACGSGWLLIEAGELIRAQGSKDYALYGQEVNGSTWALARMNMFLHGKDAARIEWGDTLNSPALIEADRLMRFDVVVANPPFSLDKWGAEHAHSDRFNRSWRGVPPKSKGDYAFITHMVETALPQAGRVAVAVVVPHGVLFRGGAEGRIRQKLIEDNLLDSVIGLPANLFPTTSIPVAVLVFDRAREKGGGREFCRDVLFIDASREFQAAKTQNALFDSHLDKIVATFEARRNVDKYAYVASLSEIAENDFNLNIPRYVDTFKEEEEILCPLPARRPQCCPALLQDLGSLSWQTRSARPLRP